MKREIVVEEFFRCSGCDKRDIWDSAICEVIYYCPNCGSPVDQEEELKEIIEKEADNGKDVRIKK